MREILFRGKRIDNGEWVEGSLITNVFYHVGEGNSIAYILSVADIEYDSWDDFDDDYGIYEVDPTTVGQYTGLTDKNGKKIFERDIVVVPLSGKPAKGIVEYFKTDICGFVVITQPQYSNYVLQKNCTYEVIGNIHDNPRVDGGPGR